MEKPLRVLMVEDQEDDARLVEGALAKAGVRFTCQRVCTEKDFLRHLKDFAPDIILADYKLASFTGKDALALLKESGEDIPFIFVTEPLNEETAVECMKAGATNYILKDHLLRLGPAVKAAVDHHAVRREKARVEQALLESEKKFRLMYEEAPLGYQSLDENGCLLVVNNAWCDILGYGRHEVIGKWFGDFLAPEYQPLFKERFPKFKAAGAVHDVEFTLVSKHGKPVLVSFDGRISYDEQGRFKQTHCIMTEITKRKEMENALRNAYEELKETQSQLIQSAKMAAMGQLVAGVSHELNQPLTGIKGFAQTALLSLDGNTPLPVLKEDLRRILEQSERMERIIKNLRLFNRKSDMVTSKFSLNKPIQDALALLQQQFKVNNISLTLALEEELPEICGDTNQLQQVFLNLLTNARDAIEGSDRKKGGEVAIKTMLCPDRKRVEAVVKDNGSGIPPKHIDRIFEPFFTTKSPAGGMGLGLAICYRVIELHKGYIEVASEHGKGTEFKVILPVA